MCFEFFDQNPVYRVQCRTWNKAAVMGLCSAEFRCRQSYRTPAAIKARKMVADAIWQDRKNGLANFKKRRFFDYAFQKCSLPARLREFVEWFCIQANIRGICDPVYIANVVGAETGIGDGMGSFYHLKPDNLSEGVEKAVKRLRFAYSTCLSGVEIPDSLLANKLQLAVSS